MLLLGWSAVLFLTVLSITQWVGSDRWKPLAIVQSLSLHALTCALPIEVAASFAGEPWLAVAALVPLACLLWLVVPAILSKRDLAAPPATVSLAFANLLAVNRDVPAVMAAVAATGADVLALAEFTPEMSMELDRHCCESHPHRIEAPLFDPAGMALWSRFPLRGERMVPLGGRPGIDTTIELDSCEFRLLVMHTAPPTKAGRQWSDELAEIGRVAANGNGPTVLLGDFNAARWHPSFRRLLALGWRTAHEWAGQWWRGSWPTHGLPAPVFVRLDHALLRGGVAPCSVRDVALPGSDHRGFVVDLVVTGR
jgi:endonuclease/exonuclease/phosphatase (EEP) superfamily protein YafD